MSMSPPMIQQPVPKKDIVIKQNATFSLGLCIVERDETGAAVVVDTAGWEAVLQVRPLPGPDGPILLNASTANGRILTGIQGDPGEQVNIDIKIPAVDTADLAYFGCAGYDLLVVYPNGDRDYYLQGQATLQPAYSWEDTP